MAKELPDGIIRRPGRDGYYADFTSGGRRVRKFLSTEFEAACRIFRRIRSRADEGNFGMLDNDLTIDTLRTAYIKHVQQSLRPRTVERYEHSLDLILPALGATKVNQLQPTVITTYRAERLSAGASPRSINHDTIVLSAMLNWGVDHHLIGSNPLKGLKRLRHDNPRERRPLDGTEVERLLSTSREPWRAIWYGFLTTGMRAEELEQLRFDNLDMANREIVVHSTVAKNHRERRIPIDDELYTIFERRIAERDQRQPGKWWTPKLTALIQERFTRDHVFTTTQCTPIRHRNLLRTFKACCVKAKIDTEGPEHVDIHSLRVTFATSLIEAGADPKSVQELLGHQTLDMTMRIYTKIRGETKRNAIARLPYGSGSQTPEHLLELARDGHQPVTNKKSALSKSPQVVAAQRRARSLTG